MTFKELIRSKGFTQTRLSQVSGVSQSNLSIYSNYRETLESSSKITRLRLSEALGFSLDEFESILKLEPAKIAGTNKQLGNYELYEVK
jgi:transcriptional regulator with XRE-family HTH domain